MKKLVYVLGVSFVLFSCAEAEDKLCNCIKVGDELNEKTHEIITNGATEKSANELKALRKKQDKICKEFKNMNGAELMKRKETCEKK